MRGCGFDGRPMRGLSGDRRGIDGRLAYQFPLSRISLPRPEERSPYAIAGSFEMSQTSRDTRH